MKQVVSSLAAWLDHRTGVNQVIHEALFENVPSGARWRYVTGSMLVFAFVVQAVTGIFLWMAYSPSSQTAYESVYYIQHEMTGGWLLRGVHHFMAQAMIVLLGAHLLQVIVDSAYKAPREINYWLGIVLMQLVLGLGLTGYLLPWDQKGFWATNVATNLMTLVPFVGKDLQQLVLGGGDYGHHTLTRFFALHVGVLPALLIAFLGLHIAVFRRHGITPHITPGRADQFFWPHQVLKDSVACLVLLGVVVMFACHWDIGGLFGGMPDEHRGAELGAPADPSVPYSAARPEWYFLFLFQLLKYFKSEFVGAIVVPGIIMTVLAMAPIIAKANWGHKFNVAYMFFLLIGAGVLTMLALDEDSNNKEFAIAKEEAHHDAQRVVELYDRRRLVDGEISDPMQFPKQGAVYLFRNDPKTQGPKLFSRHCASCHAYVDPSGQAAVTIARFQDPHAESDDQKKVVVRDSDGNVTYPDYTQGSGGPNLFGFASRAWVRGLLDPEKLIAFELQPPKYAEGDDQSDRPEVHRRRIYSPYFGDTAHRDGRMTDWVTNHMGDLKDGDLSAIAAALSAQARLPDQREADVKDVELIGRGVKIIQSTCTNGCHRFGSHGQTGLAPDLTGYGSFDWMMGFVSDPAHHRFYRMENDRMPSFAASLDDPKQNVASMRELGLIVDWLRGNYYEPGQDPPRVARTEDAAERAVLAARYPGLPRPVGVAEPVESEAEKARRLFVSNCAGCHSHTDASGLGVVAKHPTAPNLYGFGSREWLAGLFDPEQIAGPRYFGNTSHFEGEMVSYVSDELGGLDDAGKTRLSQLIAALSAEAKLPYQAELEAETKADIEAGMTVLTEAVAPNGTSCVDCHSLDPDEPSAPYPVLKGWASPDWLKGMIANPNHDRYYKGENDRMPAFSRHAAGDSHNLLSDEEIDLLARWLRREVE